MAGYGHKILHHYHLRGGTPVRQWYETAAAEGDARTQTHREVLDQNGQGMPEDYVRTYRWHSLTATHSTSNAQQFAVTIEMRSHAA